MKKFIYNILKFSVPVVVIILCFLLYYVNSKIKSDQEVEKISQAECLLMGDSQMQRIKGDYFDLNTFNFASSAEHYYFTYQKLKQLLRNENNQIKVIILGVSVHSFAPVYNRLFDLSFPEGKESLKQQFYFINPAWNDDFVKPAKLPFKNLILGLLRKPDFDGFKESEYSNPDSLTIHKTFEMHYSIKKDEAYYCYSQQKYLFLIDRLCFEKGIDLFICSTPYHPYYSSLIESNYNQFFYKTIQGLKADHINFLNDEPNTNRMSDASHLNKEGAAIYSQKISEMIKINESD